MATLAMTAGLVWAAAGLHLLCDGVLDLRDIRRRAG